MSHLLLLVRPERNFRVLASLLIYQSLPEKKHIRLLRHQHLPSLRTLNELVSPLSIHLSTCSKLRKHC